MNRTLAPSIKPIVEINTHFPVSSNNLFLIKSEEGVFKLDIIYPNAGQVNHPNKFLVAMTTNLILSGNDRKSASDISNEIDGLGGFVFKSSDFYNTSITIYGLNEHLASSLKIVKDAIDSVTFPEEEIIVYKRNRLSELKINLQKTAYIASKAINRLLLGTGHDISFETTEDIIQSTERQDIIDFKSQYFTNPYFIFTGSESSPIESILKINNFGIHPFNYFSHKDMLPMEGDLKSEIIARESNQNSIRYGMIWPERGHEDYFKLSLLNLIFGGYFGSRLMKNIREDKGLTYGIHSSLTPYNDFSLFKISCEYNSQFTDKLRQEISNEIIRLQNELVSEDELITAKNYLLGAMLRSFDGAFPISEKFKQFIDSNLSNNYYDDYFKAINDISSEDLMKIANNYLQEKSLVYCIVGAQ